MTTNCVDEILQEISDKPTDTITKKLNAYYKDKPEDRGTLKLSDKEIKLLKITALQFSMERKRDKYLIFIKFSKAFEIFN